LFFYQYTELSSSTVVGNQIYSGGSVVGKASTIGIEIYFTPNVIFTGGGGSKSAKFGVVFIINRQSPSFEPPAFETAARHHIRTLK